MSLFHHECREWGESHTHDLLHHVIHQNEQIIHNQEKIMSTIADLDSSITGLETAVAKLGTDLTAAIADLEAKINANPSPTVDTAPEIARVKAIADKLTNFDASAVAADPGPQTPPAPTPVVTSTTLTGPTDPIVENTPIALTGTVVGDGKTVPTGTVTITDATGVVSLTALLDSTGAFVATAPGLPAGSYSLNAAYAGDAANEASSASLSLTVTPAA